MPQMPAEAGRPLEHNKTQIIGLWMAHFKSLVPPQVCDFVSLDFGYWRTSFVLMSIRALLTLLHMLKEQPVTGL